MEAFLMPRMIGRCNLFPLNFEEEKTVSNGSLHLRARDLASMA